MEKPVCSLSKRGRTLFFIHLLSLRPALQVGSAQCQWGQEAQPGAEGGPAYAGLLWHRVLGPAGCR